ncbi:MAG: MarR family transcriptional regulator [Dactylosporangium sp.]|nr:MarR family transcriptional regulator [Dactylosporangium sp.]NNJ60354.1 MarR family transcriptional regulator [Dactylosporangium sp.]
MDKLTPSAQRTLDALNTGPGNVHELSERTGRSRSTTDKAINDLAKAGLIVKVDVGGDPAGGAPTRWQFAAPALAADEAGQPTDAEQATESDTDVSGTAETDAATPDEATEPARLGDAPDPADEPQPLVTETPESGEGQISAGSDADAQPDSTATPNGKVTTDGDTTADGEAKQDGGDKEGGSDKQAEVEPPKLCRGCQAQMPKVCECCWQKTPAYCGTCRRTMPQVRRGEPGEPIILSNGLPKLRPGELEAMVEKVMREQPLPAFGGVVGWTGGRLAIHLPGRSPGAITNAMRKFTTTGKAELIGDNPERYKLQDTEQPDADTNSEPSSDGQDEASRTDATQPTAEATGPAADATEPQSTSAA